MVIRMLIEDEKEKSYYIIVRSEGHRDVAELQW